MLCNIKHLLTETGESMGRFGATLGSGAAKLGKKAAQSEAGRSAGRAAVAGATEGVKEDLTNRYLGDGGSRDSSPAPATPTTPKPTTNPSSSSSLSSPSSARAHQQAPTAPAPTSSFRSEPRPPKPSLLNKFRPHINKPSSSRPAARPVRQSSRKQRVYKYNLSKEANWEEKLKVQTLYNFKSDERSDLEFRRGQVIQVLTRTDSTFDWWEGKLDDCVGIFPANYVKIIRD